RRVAWPPRCVDTLVLAVWKPDLERHAVQQQSGGGGVERTKQPSGDVVSGLDCMGGVHGASSEFTRDCSSPRLCAGYAPVLRWRIPDSVAFHTRHGSRWRVLLRP